MKNCSILLLCLLACCAQPERHAGNIDLTSVRLQSIDGTDFSLNETAKNRATVFVFLLPECPASENYTLTLNDFSRKYMNDSIMFYGVFPAFVKPDEAQTFRETFHITFPLLHDAEHSLAKQLDAHIAPEAFLLGQQHELLYRGRIDDWMYAVGQKRTVITHHELQDALDAIVAGKKIAVTQTKAVGCIID